MLGGVFYGASNFTYTESDYLFQEIKTPSIPVYGIQTSIQLVLSKGFRIGTGLNFLVMKGKTKPVAVGKDLLNTNTTGDFTLDVNNSYLQIPLDFIVTLTQKTKIKPFLTGGLNFHIPLKESFFAKIDPINPTPYYGKLEAQFGNGKEYRGLFVGSGIIIPFNEKREMEVRLAYRSTIFFYETLVLGSGGTVSKRPLKFNIIELSIGVVIF